MACYAKPVVYAGIEMDVYQTRLLSHVLSYPKNESYQVQAYGTDMPKGRAFNLLASGKGIDVMFGGSNIERESKYQPIRFPLMKGLNGWRIPLVNSNKQDVFANINSLQN